MESQNTPNIDMDKLNLARSRINPEYVRMAIDNARLSIQLGAGVMEIDESLFVSSEGGSNSATNINQNEAGLIPDFPPITNFDGEPMLQVLNMNAATAPEEPMADALALPGVDEDAMESDENAKFKTLEKWFNGLKSPSIQDRIRYEIAKRKFDIRKKRSERREALQESDNEDEYEDENDQTSGNELFCSQIAEPEPSNDDTSLQKDGKEGATRKKAKRVNRISAEEKRKSMAVGFYAALQKLNPKKRRQRLFKKGEKGKSSQPPSTIGKHAQGENKEDAQPRELSSLFSDLVEEAHASSSLPAAPTLANGRRNKAIAQLIASIPNADDKELQDDKELLQNALKKFTHRIRNDGKGGWRIKGLKTSLYHYQVLGCAFMRDRENSPIPPYGGLLCDVMGFGKTLQALVNIIDGIPLDEHDPVKTTLLVVPSHLVKHWMQQIRLHCDTDTIGPVVEYHAQGRLLANDLLGTLNMCRIIVTTYEEIRRSYPSFRPEEGVEHETLWGLWKKIYEAKLGPLHRIKYQRIILDEAHMIKNHMSRVSVAVRGLVGHHKWLLSGTPITNSLDEFYPLFDFIGVPQIGTHEDFVLNYCSDDDGKQRLINLLRSFMYRRTHASRLFSRPILTLPDIQTTIKKVEFCEAEKVLYQAITESFVEDFNNLADNPAAQTSCFLAIILKQRMFCSHLLTVQDTIRKILRESLIKELAQASKNGHPSSKIFEWIIKLQQDYQTLVDQQLRDDQGQPEDRQILNNEALLGDFYRFMASLQVKENWVELAERHTCPQCNQKPDKPVVTSCMHQYCEECFCYLSNEAEKSGKAKPSCLKCEAFIEEAALSRFSEGKETAKPATQTRHNKKKAAPKRKQKEGNEKDKPQDDEEIDWIKVCKAKMPGAKLAGTKSLIKKWKKEDKTVKVVIFCQFLNFIRILTEMCKEEKWGYRCLTGKMRIPMRNKSLDDFQTDSGITILIASLRTGGTGLDMTCASKCILVDPWWNEAVQDQAYFRLLRHGQQKDVECVKMIAEKSIDDHLLKLQLKKTKEITSTMGEEVLKKRDNIISLLRMFENVVSVEQRKNGGLIVKTKPKQKRKAKSKGDATIAGGNSTSS